MYGMITGWFYWKDKKAIAMVNENALFEQLKKVHR
jgi:hypothetical protein